MPREREEFFRVSNSIEKERIFILAFEGNETEEIYFSAFRNSNKFNTDLIYLHLLSRPKGDTRSAPIHVFNKLKREAKDEFNFNQNDELWMIIDRDRWSNIPEIVSTCSDLENMYVAVSNPCFEFWLLLHLKDLSEFSDEEKQKLFENRKISKSRNYIETKIIEIAGSYSKSKLKASDFIPNIDAAVQRSSELDKPRESFPTKLGSHVYKLIQKIQSV